MIAPSASPERSMDTLAAKADLAPSGTLRAAINFDNTILASKDAVSGEPGGVSVELAREVALRLGAKIEFVPYYAAGKVVEGLQSAAWDICFLAIDPVRAKLISFTAPYVVIEGAYLVTQDSPLRDNDDVDRPGIRVAVSTGSAYDLFLSRELKHASLVRAPSAKDVVGMFLAQQLDVAAGVRPMLEADVREHAGLRMLPGRFMAINQAMGTPRGRDAGAAYLAAFVEEMKASGFVANALARNRIVGATVAPQGKSG
jgi:polar amino acid transport system substrate-binding protein